MPLNIKTITPEEQSLLIMLYGDTGTGKTTLASQLMGHERFEKILFLDIDLGLTTIAHKHPMVVTINNTKDLEELVTEFLKPDKQRDEALIGVNTLVVDSLSELRDEVLREIATHQASIGKRPDQYTQQLQDYLKMMNVIIRNMDALRRRGVNMIFTAGEDRREDAGILQEIRPALNKALMQKVGHQMDFIWYLSNRNGYKMKVLPGGGVIQIKTRNPVFAERLREFTRSEAPEGQKDKMEGWVMLPDPNTSILPELLDMYYTSNGGTN